MSPAAGVPRRALAAIAVAVLCVHGLALRSVPHSPPWRPAPAPVVVDLRTLVLPAPPHDVPVQASAPTPPLPSHITAPAAKRAPSQVEAPVRRPMPSARATVAVAPPSATWQYAASGQWRGAPVSGDATLAWHHDGRSYEASFTLAAPPLPAREQRSTGTIAAEGLQPERFAERQRSEAAAHFDRSRDRIVFSSNRPEAMLRPGAQDRLSLLLQLPALAAADPARFAPGREVVVQVAGTRDADDWRFAVEGVEDLALGGDTVPALRLTRAVRGPYDPRLELWLAPGRDYALVRLRLTPPGGDWLDMQWSGTDKR